MFWIYFKLVIKSRFTTSFEREFCGPKSWPKKWFFFLSIYTHLYCCISWYGSVVLCWLFLWMDGGARRLRSNKDKRFVICITACALPTAHFPWSPNQSFDIKRLFCTSLFLLLFILNITNNHWTMNNIKSNYPFSQ